MTHLLDYFSTKLGTKILLSTQNNFTVRKPCRLYYLKKGNLLCFSYQKDLVLELFNQFVEKKTSSSSELTISRKSGMHVDVSK